MSCGCSGWSRCSRSATCRSGRSTRSGPCRATPRWQRPCSAIAARRGWSRWLDDQVGILVAAGYWTAGLPSPPTRPRRSTRSPVGQFGEREGLVGLALLVASGCVGAWSLRRPAACPASSTSRSSPPRPSATSLCEAHDAASRHVGALVVGRAAACAGARPRASPAHRRAAAARHRRRLPGRGPARRDQPRPGRPGDRPPWPEQRLGHARARRRRQLPAGDRGARPAPARLRDVAARRADRLAGDAAAARPVPAGGVGGDQRRRLRCSSSGGRRCSRADRPAAVARAGSARGGARPRCSCSPHTRRRTCCSRPTTRRHATSPPPLAVGDRARLRDRRRGRPRCAGVERWRIGGVACRTAARWRRVRWRLWTLAAAILGAFQMRRRGDPSAQAVHDAFQQGHVLVSVSAGC